MASEKMPVAQINQLSQADFVAALGGTFEHSPWVAERAWNRRPFASVDALLDAMWNAVAGASTDEKMKLIRAHPDLVGRAADRAEALTRESAGEQAAAGLINLSPAEIAAFRDYNQQYWNRFDFPFIICARENKKEAILAAFPKRLGNSRQQEISTALDEIRKIARLRLMDRIEP